MGVADILSTIDGEIAILQRARALLIGESAGSTKKAGKRLTLSVKTPNQAAKKAGKNRHLTPEGRRRIAEAVKRRWEKHRKAASK